MLLLSNYKDNNFRDTYTYFIVSTADFLMLIKQSLPPASVSGRSKRPGSPIHTLLAVLGQRKEDFRCKPSK